MLDLPIDETMVSLVERVTPPNGPTGGTTTPL
jgi:hypothetical protein